MKSIFPVCILLLWSCFAAAQVPQVSYSTPFEEPEAGWNKVLQLKNGNTFFFHFTKKEGIEVVVYDAMHQVKSTKLITSNHWEAKKMRESVVEGLYEIGGQPVIFLHQMIDRTPKLFRIRLDANTGAVEEDILISALPKYKAGSAWAMAYGGVQAADFFVEKDPNSDAYAVVNFNSFSGESDERIELIHYNVEGKSHKVLNRSFYDSPDGQFKYLNLIAMNVTDQQVLLCVYGYTSKWSANDAKIIISKLTTADKNFTHKQLDFTEDFRGTKGVMKLNKGTGMLHLMTLTLVQNKGGVFGGGTHYYMSFLSIIDPNSMMILTMKPLLSKKVSEDLHRQIEKLDAFKGLPQQMVINADYSTTILEEEMATYTQVNQYGTVVSATTTLGSIGISQLNDKAEELDGHVILKLQTCNGIMDPMYLSEKSKGKWSYRSGAGINNNAFLSFDYVSTVSGNYVLFNDYPDNFEKEEGKRKRKAVMAISNASTVCYVIKQGKLDKYYLFGTPVNNDQSKFCYIESSHFLENNSTYATLLMEKNGKKKEAKIAWVKFN